MKLLIPTLMLIGFSTFCYPEEISPPLESDILTPSLPARPPQIKTEIDMASEAIGINYSHLERMALRGNHDALAVIVALTFDGGAGEMMRDMKTYILARCPADEVAAVLKIYAPAFRAKIVEQMRKDFLFLNGDSPAVIKEFDRRFGSLTENEPEQKKKQNK